MLEGRGWRGSASPGVEELGAGRGDAAVPSGDAWEAQIQALRAPSGPGRVGDGDGLWRGFREAGETRRAAPMLDCCIMAGGS